VQHRLEQICALPQHWHGAGTVSDGVLRIIAEHYPRPLDHSAETGTGRSTLLLSQLSANHLVFAKDDRGDGDSLELVRSSDLLRSSTTTFVVGPTQLTLPSYQLRQPLDLVFLDGPHGFPFPQLEYYYFYPHIRPGGLLILDDTQIPSISGMHEFLREDDMWHLNAVVDYTAFYTRTDAPTLDPLADGWWLQGYNRTSRAAAWRDSARARARQRAPAWLKSALRALPWLR